MMRNLRLLLMLLKMKLSHMMVFRWSFFGAFFVDGSLFAIEILAFSAIYANVGSIGGWTRPEMLIFIGTFSLINALNMSLFFFGVLQIPEKIVRGELDHYLTKPMSPLLRLTFENMDPGSVPLIFGSIGVIAYGASGLPNPPGWPAILGYIPMTLLMTLLWYDMELILRCIPFFVTSARNVDEVEGSVITLCFRIPGTLFEGVFKVLFCFFLPYGIMATIPAQMLAGTLTPAGLAYGVGVAALFTWFALWLWRKGLGCYKSASG